MCGIIIFDREGGEEKERRERNQIKRDTERNGRERGRENNQLASDN